MKLNSQQIKRLKQQAHHLKPVVMLGQLGLSDNVMHEIDLSLLAHELIKVKLAGLDRQDRVKIGNEISQRLQANLVQIIGQIAILYRPNPDKKNHRIVV
jgi:RNA-binding protein